MLYYFERYYCFYIFSYTYPDFPNFCLNPIFFGNSNVCQYFLLFVFYIEKSNFFLLVQIKYFKRVAKTYTTASAVNHKLIGRNKNIILCWIKSLASGSTNPVYYGCKRGIARKKNNLGYEELELLIIKRFEQLNNH